MYALFRYDNGKNMWFNSKKVINMMPRRPNILLYGFIIDKIYKYNNDNTPADLVICIAKQFTLMLFGL